MTFVNVSPFLANFRGKCLQLFRKLSIGHAFFGEFWSTYVILVLVNGAGAQYMILDVGAENNIGPKFAAAIATIFGILIAGGVSGAHSNPAFSLLFALRGTLPWSQLPVFWLAQYLGAFAGAASVLGVYSEALHNKTDLYAINNTDAGYAGIFGTYSAPYETVPSAIGELLLVSGILGLCVTAMTDKRNLNLPLPMLALYLGFLILGLACGYSGNAGGSPNPARDLAPRLLTYFAGWGVSVFSFHDWQWFWIPLVVPHIGVYLGYVTYFLFIEAHWPPIEKLSH